MFWWEGRVNIQADAADSGSLFTFIVFISYMKKYCANPHFQSLRGWSDIQSKTQTEGKHSSSQHSSNIYSLTHSHTEYRRLKRNDCTRKFLCDHNMTNLFPGNQKWIPWLWAWILQSWLELSTVFFLLWSLNFHEYRKQNITDQLLWSRGNMTWEITVCPLWLSVIFNIVQKEEEEKTHTSHGTKKKKKKKKTALIFCWTKTVMCYISHISSYIKILQKVQTMLI